MSEYPLENTNVECTFNTTAAVVISTVLVVVLTVIAVISVIIVHFYFKKNKVKESDMTL